MCISKMLCNVAWCIIRKLRGALKSFLILYNMIKCAQENDILPFRVCQLFSYLAQLCSATYIRSRTSNLIGWNNNNNNSNDGNNMVPTNTLQTSCIVIKSSGSTVHKLSTLVVPGVRLRQTIDKVLMREEVVGRKNF